jgi:hypothetical protein
VAENAEDSQGLLSLFAIVGPAVNERVTGRFAFIAHSQLCASAALDLQVHCVDVRLQIAGPPERHALAVAVQLVPGGAGREMKDERGIILCVSIMRTAYSTVV